MLGKPGTCDPREKLPVCKSHPDQHVDLQVLNLFRPGQDTAGRVKPHLSKHRLTDDLHATRKLLELKQLRKLIVQKFNFMEQTLHNQVFFSHFQEIICGQRSQKRQQPPFQ